MGARAVDGSLASSEATLCLLSEIGMPTACRPSPSGGGKFGRHQEPSTNQQVARIVHLFPSDGYLGAAEVTGDLHHANPCSPVGCGCTFEGTARFHAQPPASSEQLVPEGCHVQFAGRSSRRTPDPPTLRPLPPVVPRGPRRPTRPRHRLVGLPDLPWAPLRLRLTPGIVARSRSGGGRAMTTTTTPRPRVARCWYGSADHRPRMSSCPASCDGSAETHAERLLDGVHYYCDEHAHWRARDVGRQQLRRLRPDELT
jgi:hypothetical protein